MIESADEYVRLRESNDGAAWQRIKREEAPLQVWLDIVRNHPDMRFWVTFNRTVPVQVLREISGDPDLEGARQDRLQPPHARGPHRFPVP
ncbi:hypothetical protein HDA36_002456 [Nocardiopsis composta]|uniref:Uncharacterized protein n=1 Tax=Nocardiopsis composta TaxID=157465 RepID=A0A7W8VDL2_9ACTN|nr:hypothetical protein [Nocardiopsis composta]